MSTFFELNFIDVTIPERDALGQLVTLFWAVWLYTQTDIGILYQNPIFKRSYNPLMTAAAFLVGEPFLAPRKHLLKYVNSLSLVGS